MTKYFAWKIFSFLRIWRDWMKNCGLSYETPLFFLLPPRFFLKRRPFLRPSCRPLFPHPHIRTREQTRSCASRTQRVSNSRLHPSPSPAIRWHIVFCAWRNAILLPSPVKEIRVKPSPANHCFIASYSRIVKRWRQKTKNSGRARVGGWGGMQVHFRKRASGSYRGAASVRWTTIQSICGIRIKLNHLICVFV